MGRIFQPHAWHCFLAARLAQIEKRVTAHTLAPLIQSRQMAHRFRGVAMAFWGGAGDAREKTKAFFNLLTRSESPTKIFRNVSGFSCVRLGIFWPPLDSHA